MCFVLFGQDFIFILLKKMVVMSVHVTYIFVCLFRHFNKEAPAKIQFLSVSARKLQVL